ncbi:MAG: PDZ domain-containing protein [Pirellulaceae bacterium]|nr:PDZ domain-containing protein [Pirellulaceae bacterium]
MWRPLVLAWLVTGCMTISSLSSSWAQQGAAEAVSSAPAPESTNNSESVVSQETASAEQRLWLGIALKSVGDDLAAFLGSDHGVLVDQVHPDSPAASAGLKKGDVILAVDGQLLHNPSELVRIMATAKADRPLALRIQRQAGEVEIAVVPQLRSQDILQHPDWTKELGDVSVRIAPHGKELKVLRFGDPSMIRISPKLCEAICGDVNIQLKRNLNGQEVEVSVLRKEGQPAEITLRRGDETKTLTQDQLDQIPEDIGNWLRSALNLGATDKSAESNQISQLAEVIQLLGGEGAAEGKRQLGQWLDQIKREYAGPIEEAISNSLAGAESGAELAKQWATSEEAKAQIDQIRQRLIEQAKLAAEQTRAHAQQARQTAEQATEIAKQRVESEEITQLKNVVEQLRHEIDQLRKKLTSAERPE